MNKLKLLSSLLMGIWLCGCFNLQPSVDTSYNKFTGIHVAKLKNIVVKSSHGKKIRFMIFKGNGSNSKKEYFLLYQDFSYGYESTYTIGNHFHLKIDNYKTIKFDRKKLFSNYGNNFHVNSDNYVVMPINNETMKRMAVANKISFEIEVPDKVGSTSGDFSSVQIQQIAKFYRES